MRRTAWPFAGRCGKRPSGRWAAKAAAAWQARRSIFGCGPLLELLASKGRGSATGGVRAERVGIERFLRAIAGGRAEGFSPRLLACDSLVGSPRKERCHPHDRASPKGEGREELCAWATARRVSGVRAITWSCSRFVSIAEVDRRRLASAAWTRPRRSGLAPPARADGGRKRVGSRPSGGKAAGTVAGHDGPCESRSRAAPVEGRRSGQLNPRALTSGWRKRL